MLKQGRKSILFRGRLSSPFIRGDLDKLREEFTVRVFNNKREGLKKYLTFPLKLPKILTAVLEVEIVFIWFAAGIISFITALFANLLGKKLVLVAGGHDAAEVPEFNYGTFASWWHGNLSKYMLEHAEIVLAVSKFQKKQVLGHANPKRIEVVYNAVDCSYFKPRGEKDDDLIITVGGGPGIGGSLKGLDTFIKVAEELPEKEFIVIGTDPRNFLSLQKIAPENVKFTGHLPVQKVLTWYQKAKVYCQLSYIESFGLSLAEAMACECIPVVTKKGGMPEVVGDLGFFVPFGSPQITAKTIKKAIKENNGRKARTRVKKRFSLEKRGKKLKEIIKRL